MPSKFRGLIVRCECVCLYRRDEKYENSFYVSQANQPVKFIGSLYLQTLTVENKIKNKRGKYNILIKVNKKKSKLTRNYSQF